MDQIRKILAWLKQYHFWLLSVLIILIPLFCWWIASGAMSKQFADAKSQIEQGFSQVTALQSKPFHPNERISGLQQDENKKLLDEVKKLWQALYDSQREAVLIWPKELDPQFIATVEKLKFGADIPDEWLEHYQNYIKNHFPRLPEVIKARAIEEGQAGTGGPASLTRVSPRMSREGPGTMSTSGEFEDDGSYLCEWAEEDQAAIRDVLEFPQTPSPLRIWWTQENLWVYHALLDVIKNTNDAAKATRISNAAVRRIYSLQVGKDAAQFSRQPNHLLVKLAAPAAAAPGAESEPGASPTLGGMEGPASGFEPGEGGPGVGTNGQMSDEQERGVLLSRRYLGEDGKPIPYGAGASAEAPAEPPDPNITAPPLDLSMFGKEYKRLPVRMVLEMDQRYLPTLITECAMQSLQIEVQEVRVNAADILSGAGGGATSRMGPGEGGAISMPELSGGLQQFNPHPEIATVAIQGVIYIFNEPNEELLAPPAEDAGALTQVP